jgi:hypothetical protein
MRTIRSFLLAVVLVFTAVSAARSADDGPESLRINYDDKTGVAEKTEHSPVMQYALAGIMVLSVLVVICKPSRKAY